jgi:hypothetical protein
MRDHDHDHEHDHDHDPWYWYMWSSAPKWHPVHSRCVRTNHPRLVKKPKLGVCWGWSCCSSRSLHRSAKISSLSISQSGGPFQWSWYCACVGVGVNMAHWHWRWRRLPRMWLPLYQPFPFQLIVPFGAGVVVGISYCWSYSSSCWHIILLIVFILLLFLLYWHFLLEY